MKLMYKSAKVVYDAYLEEYQVYYKNWLVWKYDTCYKYDTNPRQPVHYRTKEEAEKRAIERASALLKTSVIWQQSNFSYTE
jgi:hypothetical protein